MREIKFKAWDSYQKKMYEWNEICKMDSEGHLTLSNLLNGFIDHIKPIEFTGLKDKNGKEIYDYDIYKRHNYIYKVFWSEEDCGFKGAVIGREDDFKKGTYKKESSNAIYDLVNDGRMEIIGNIYENKNLIK